MKTIDSLRDDIKELLIQKFGSIVDIDDVEEAYLKKLVYDLRMSQTDIKSLYLEEMQYWRVILNVINFPPSMLIIFFFRITSKKLK